MLTVNNPNQFDWANISLADCAKGNAMDAYFTLKLYDLIREKLESEGVLDLIENIIEPALTVFTEMEFDGLEVDMDALASVGRDLNLSLVDTEDNMYDFPEVSTKRNLSSNNDLIEILYTDTEGFGLYPPDKTPKGKPSVSAPTLKLLLEFVNEELERRG